VAVPKPVQRPTFRKTEGGPEDKRQLRQERTHVIIMVLAILAVFALVIMLASLGPVPENVEPGPPFLP